MKSLPKVRLDAFADGVFAIAITLLVLDLPVPEVSEDIIRPLMEAWPEFLAYMISFAFIGGIWISHASITHLMKQESSTSYRLTLLMLFFVSILPFSTKLMATHLSGPNASVAVVIYGLDLFAASIVLNQIIKTAINHPEFLVDELDEGELNALLRKRQYVVVIAGCAVILAFFIPRAAIAVYDKFRRKPTIFSRGMNSYTS
ncbi:MAG: TMEM175 family protein [Methanotrichaceae archaeon]|nr:TMEM175 family protein [Methanotrichaceae archaeon]